ASGAYRWSESVEPLLGRPAHEVADRVEALFDLVPEEDRAGVLAHIKDAIAGDGTLELKHRVVRPDGDVRWVVSKGRIQYDNGVAVSIIGATIDVTDRHQAEQRLRETEERLRMVVRNSPVVVFAFDADGVVTLWEGAGGAGPDESAVGTS